MSGNRKRSGPGATILDQLEPGAARAKAAFRMHIEPRWLFAGAGAIALLIAILSAIAWNNGPRTLKPAPAMAAELPEFETGPARVERVAPADSQSAETLLAHSEPPPVPLVVLPSETTGADTVRIEEPETPPRMAAPPPARNAVKPRPMVKPAIARQSPSRNASKRARNKPEPVPEAVAEPDPDVALISAIRRATDSNKE